MPHFAPWKMGASRNESCESRIDPAAVCGICRGGIDLDKERIIALAPRENSSRIDVKRLQFPFYYKTNSCAIPQCKGCRLQCETATVHGECFDQFPWDRKESGLKQGLLLRRLWKTIVWRKPFKACKQLYLDDDVGCSYLAVMSAAKRLGLSQLQKLPAEAIDMIESMSLGAPFWRIVKSLELYYKLLSMQDGQVTSALLERVKGWERGEPLLHLEEQENALPWICITIDSNGIRSIQRKAEHPTETTGNIHNNRAYIWYEEISNSGICLLMKDGMCRLQLREEHHGFQVWDTSTPPRLLKVLEPPTPQQLAWGNRFPWQKLEIEGFDLCGERVLTTSRFRTVDLVGATGLTFFYSQDGLHGISTHTEESPSAQQPLTLGLDSVVKPVYSIYVPIAPGDEIEWMAVRAVTHDTFDSRILPPSFMLKLKLAGSVSVSPDDQMTSPTSLVIKSPQRLIYNTKDFEAITTIGIYSSTTDGQNGGCPTPPDGFPNVPANASGVPRLSYQPLKCYSTAPLENVALVRVYESERGVARGVWLQYDNGAQRALGECRIGKDEYLEYDRPEQVYHAQVHSVSLESFRIGVGLRFDSPENMRRRLGQPGQGKRKFVESDEDNNDNNDKNNSMEDEMQRALRGEMSTTSLWVAREMQGALEYWLSREESWVGHVVHRRGPSQLPIMLSSRSSVPLQYQAAMMSSIPGNSALSHW